MFAGKKDDHGCVNEGGDDSQSISSRMAAPFCGFLACKFFPLKGGGAFELIIFIPHVHISWNRILCRV